MKFLSSRKADSEGDPFHPGMLCRAQPPAPDLQASEISTNRSTVPCVILDMMWTFILWLILLVLCWPLALIALLLYPIVWLLMLPFRLVGITVNAVFQLLKAILLLPARLLRGPGRLPA